MRTSEHFDWAVTRAMEYVDLNDPGNAMASLILDLNKHEGTAKILHSDLQQLFLGEILIGGAAGARRFIQGLPRPADRDELNTSPNPSEAREGR